MSTKDKLKKCIDEGEKGGERHKGLKKVQEDVEKSQGHLNKAIKNFNAMLEFNNLGYSDWSASAAFYTLYQGLLAILSIKGYESRNQSCTFALIEDMINKGEIKYIKIEDLKEIFDKKVNEDLEHSEKILDIREEMQYSTRTDLGEEEFKHLKQKTKEIFDKIRLELEN